MNEQLLAVLSRLAQLQSQSLDRQALAALLQGMPTPNSETEARQQLAEVARKMRWPAPRRWGLAARVDRIDLPCAIWSGENGWGLLRGQNGQGQWLTEWFEKGPSHGVSLCRMRWTVCSPVVLNWFSPIPPVTAACTS